MQRFRIDEGLVGDVVEQHQADRSRAWLWRQTSVAIAHAVVRVLRLNPARAATTALLSTTFLCAWFFGTLWLYREIDLSTIAALGHPHEFAVVRSPLLSLAWNVYCVPLHAAWMVGCLIVGRYVARHSPDGAALVVVSIILQLPVDIWFGWPYIHAVVHPQAYLGSLHLAPLLRFYPGYVFDVLVALIGMPSATITAGLCAAPHQYEGMA